MLCENVSQSDPVLQEKRGQKLMYNSKKKVNKAYVVKNKIINVSSKQSDFMKYLDLSCTIS